MEAGERVGTAHSFRVIWRECPMTRTEIEDKVLAIVESLIQGSAMEVVDVEYVQEWDWYLRIFIDKPEGVGIDDCEQLSRAVEPILDELDFLKQAYYLELC